MKGQIRVNIVFWTLAIEFQWPTRRIRCYRRFGRGARGQHPLGGHALARLVAEAVQLAPAPGAVVDGADRRGVGQPLAVGADLEAPRLELTPDDDPGIGLVREAAHVVLLPDVDGGELSPRRSLCVPAVALVLADSEGIHAAVGDDLLRADLHDVGAVDAVGGHRRGRSARRCCGGGGRGGDRERRGGEYGRKVETQRN